MFKPRRWANNFGISALNSTLVAFLLALFGIGVAELGQASNWGLFNRMQVSQLISIPVYFVLFDLTIYIQHRIFHIFKPLWRLHRVHHTDLDYDVSTGVRFHPISILISALVKVGLILILGPPAIAVLISEIVLNATSMFNHSNIRIPIRLDKALRVFLVTPDMHRVHHSIQHTEHNRNFGFNLPWWDRIFGTYKDQPEGNHETMGIGILGYDKKESIGIYSLLSQPFKQGREERQ